jgi:predicted permease
MNRLRKKLRALRRRSQLDRDLEEELRFHLDMKAEDLGDRAQAQRRIGNATALKERCRDLWAFAALESWWQDIRYAAHTLAKTPGFTLAAVLALGLGIGADTAVFTIVSGAFTWNLGLDHLDRIVLVSMTDTAGREDFGVSYPDFRDLRDQTKSLAGLAAYQFVNSNLSDDKTLPDRYHDVRMSANGFFVSEQTPLIGRSFTKRDELPGAPAVVVLTYHVWEDRYGRDPSIIGKTIRIDDVPATVIGVMPAGKRFPEDTDLWTPLVPDARAADRADRNVTLFGRLKEGVSMAAARRDLSTIADRLAKEYPATDKGLTVDVHPIAEITGAYNMQPIFAALWAAVGFVLLIACADVANMLLARGAGRMREISIRLAIGAGRARIIRQLLVESVLLSFAGGFLGWLFALGGLRWFDAATGWIVKPPWLHLSFDRTVFLYLALISTGTGILFGLAPALRLAKLNVNTALKDGAQAVAGSRRVLSLANLLVTFEMALCVILLAGAGLMIRSAVNLYDAPVGVNTQNVLTMAVNLPEAKYRSPADEIMFHRRLKARLYALPGVEATALASNLPLTGALPFSYELEGKPPDPAHAPRIGGIVVSPAYFPVMRVRPRLGRVFTDLDGVAGAPVVLVNESFAERFWPRENALGKHLRLVKNLAPQPWLTVIGVLPDILQDFRGPLQHDPLIYLPYAEEPQREMFVVAKTRVPPRTLTDAFRRTVQSIDSNLPVYDVRTLEDRLAQSRLAVNVVGGMFGVFAAIALVLAVVGLYAVVAHSISQRRQEIGVRMAIGGTRPDILRLVYAQAMRPLLFGIAVGLPAAFVVSHVLRIMLVGVSPSDPLTFCTAVLVLAAAGIAGCAIPARRAVRVDPIVALRYE